MCRNAETTHKLSAIGHDEAYQLTREKAVSDIARQLEVSHWAMSQCLRRALTKDEWESRFRLSNAEFASRSSNGRKSKAKKVVVHKATVMWGSHMSYCASCAHMIICNVQTKFFCGQTMCEKRARRFSVEDVCLAEPSTTVMLGAEVHFAKYLDILVGEFDTVRFVHRDNFGIDAGLVIGRKFGKWQLLLVFTREDKRRVGIMTNLYSKALGSVGDIRSAGCYSDLGAAWARSVGLLANYGTKSQSDAQEWADSENESDAAGYREGDLSQQIFAR
jgi:hypothetical protein